MNSTLEKNFDDDSTGSQMDNFIGDGSDGAYMIDFCLECGLHCDSCDAIDCNFEHCTGYSILCTKDNCYCDKTQYTECRYKDIINNNEKSFNGKHIIRLSNVCVQWCKKCNAHSECELDECTFEHCVCH